MFITFHALPRLAAAIVLAAGATAVQAVPVSGQGTWETTLQPRDLNGDTVADAYYDTSLKLTWLADWALAGPMTWAGAGAWTGALNLFGFTGWRLPHSVDIGDDGCNLSLAGGTDCGYNVLTAGSEMAHLWYVTLANLACCAPGDTLCDTSGTPQAGWGLGNTGPFAGMQADIHWLGDNIPLSLFAAWSFNTGNGSQYFGDKNVPHYVVAVRPGDIGAVPEPGALTLVLAGFAAAGLARRWRRRGAES